MINDKSNPKIKINFTKDFVHTFHVGPIKPVIDNVFLKPVPEKTNEPNNAVK